jgi:hypothetical protein
MPHPKDPVGDESARADAAAAEPLRPPASIESDLRRVEVTAEHVSAARLRVAADHALRRETPAWIIKLAKTAIPDERPKWWRRR